MIRFRNPVSDINIVIDVFKKLYIAFSNAAFFDLDNFAELLARENLASSSGYTGNEALKRSYSIPDDSRKSMKMQAKSYTELFRFLGWINSDSEVALKFSFTYIGMHVALSGAAAKNIFEQNLLGVEYPNHILDVKFSDVNKPFISMLLFANALGGYISRDEIILGPMSLNNGNDMHEFTEKAEFIISLRGSHDFKKLNSAIKKLSDDNSMQPNSVRNLTRFVISSLVYVGWFRKEIRNDYNKKIPFLVLTQKGRNVLNEINHSAVLFGNEIENCKIDKKELSWYAILSMFKRANFNVDSDLKACSDIANKIHDIYDKDSIIFSPFQYYSKKELDSMFPELVPNDGNSSKRIEANIVAGAEHDSLKEQKIQNLVIKRNLHFEIESLLRNTLKENANNINKSTDVLVNSMSSMKQDVFYPTVAALLGIIFDRRAFAPPAGNNNLRFDVIIPDDLVSIPVEVKSPTEEEMLSVKAIRQALENKIVMLSRKPYRTNVHMCSLAIGYYIPNKRSDVYKLIDDIYLTYHFNIAIMDITTITNAALRCLRDNIHYDIKELENKRGIMRFDHENI